MYTSFNANLSIIFSKFTFALLSQATAESQRLYHRTQNTVNRIQNSLITTEIHDQGRIKIYLNVFLYVNFKKHLAETSFCWAFSISTMLRHSLNYFVRQLARKKSIKYDICDALQFLNGNNFHKRLRIGFYNFISFF